MKTRAQSKVKNKKSPAFSPSAPDQTCFSCKSFDCPSRLDSINRWILCESCVNWFHISCCGILPSEEPKFSYFKCLFCCVAQIGGNISVDISKALSLRRKVSPPIPFDVVESAEEEDTASTSKDVLASPDLPEHTPESSACSQDYSQDQAGSQVSSGSVELSSVSSSSSQDSSVSDPSEHSYASGGVPPPAADGPPSVCVGEEDIRSKILIIDSVDRHQFKSSRDIYKEIHRFVPTTRVDQAFFLAKGGIAIYLPSKVDRDNLFVALPPSAFGGGFKKKLSGAFEYQAYVKDFPFHLNLDDVTAALSVQGVSANLSRISSSITGRPTRTVKLSSCSKVSIEKFLKGGFWVNGVSYKVEEKHAFRITRCFNCQRFGHTLNNCFAPRRCAVCSLDHAPSACSHAAKCSNCGGPHAASSLLCPDYIRHYEYLTSKYPIPEHLSDSSQISHQQA